MNYKDDAKKMLEHGYSIEEIVKRVRAETIEECMSVVPEKRGSSDTIQLMVTEQGTQEGKLHYQREYGKTEGFNACRNTILTALRDLKKP